MDPFAQDLDLPLSDDEELAQVLAFHDQFVSERDLFGLEAAAIGR